MMRGTHARDDGSFGRSASTQTLKGAALLFAALIIGVALLRTAPRSITSITSGRSATPTTVHASNPGTSVPDTSTTVALRPASQVRVLVANGAGIANLGARVRTQLNGLGYNTTKPAIDAPSSNNATSSIYFVPGFDGEALALATALSLQPTSVQQLSTTSPPVPATNLVGVDIIVIAGQDIGGTQTTQAPGATVAPGSGTGSPTTTSASTTATTVRHTTTTSRPATTSPPTTKPATTSPPTTSASHTTTTINLR